MRILSRGLADGAAVVIQDGAGHAALAVLEHVGVVNARGLVVVLEKKRKKINY